MENDISISVIGLDGDENEIIAPTDMNFSLMEVLKSSGYDSVKAICGGMAICATCHVYVLSNNKLPEISLEEEDMLDTLPNVEENSRLSCQLKLNNNFDKLKIKLAETDE